MFSHPHLLDVGTSKSITMGRTPVLDNVAFQFAPKNQYLLKIASLLTPYSKMVNMEQLCNGDMDIGETGMCMSASL